MVCLIQIQKITYKARWQILTGRRLHLAVSSASLQSLLNTQTGALAKTMDNVNSFTGGLANNNEKIDRTLTNLEATTANFQNWKLKKHLRLLNNTINGIEKYDCKCKQ